MASRLAAALLPILLLAGCMGGGDEDSDPEPTPSPTPGPATGNATLVEISSTPATAPANGKATVCFTVSGTGRVPHVAIHWDDQSHATDPSRTFQSYDLGASYPNNQSAAASSGYQLQPTGSRFCTAATMPASGSIYVVAHAIDSDGAPGDLSTERKVDVGPTNRIEIQSSTYQPAALTVRAGETITVHNGDAMTHTVSSAAGGFDTGDIPGGQTKTFSAPMAPGTYTFGCAYHPSMQGTLTVTAQ